MDLYELGECEVHLRNGPVSKCLLVGPSNRCAHFLKYDDSQKGKAILLGLREDMAAAGWEIEAVVQTEGAKASRAKTEAAKK